MKPGILTSVQQALDKILLQLKTLSFYDNFTPCRVFEDIEVEAGESVVISHGLNRVPYGRILLRHIGGGPIVDGEDWDDSVVSFSNLSATDMATITVVILG